MRRHLPLLIIFAIGLIVGASSVWYRQSLRPLASDAEERIVEIERGSGVARIARELERDGLIRNALAFRVMLLIRSPAAQLKAGHYALSPAMTPWQMAQRLVNGEVATRRLTIPEGLMLEQIADRVAEAGIAGRNEFLSAAVPATVADEVEMPPPEGKLEGYLFPETYQFTYDDGAEAVVRRMVLELQERFWRPNREEIAQRRLSLHEIVTLASLVEREAKVDEERALIAGVIQNRLDRGMLLQIDATVQYALGEHKQRLLNRDTRVDSPYNTYQHPGLPPGPIASPGLPSLMAALRPAETDALFYVAKPDGTHVFTRTNEEHERAKARIRGR
ncbi:MAG: endolytic transglycosylase MltG [Armatimonadota bacterium]|nr:endolytic transglycosylase MltG [Armatimonadota bacterium]